MREVIGVELAAIVTDDAGNEEYIPFEEVPEDQRSNLEEELLVFHLVNDIKLAKERSENWDLIHRAISRLGALV